jgi:hypothetical protein
LNSAGRSGETSIFGTTGSPFLAALGRLGNSIVLRAIGAMRSTGAIGSAHDYRSLEVRTEAGAG